MKKSSILLIGILVLRISTQAQIWLNTAGTTNSSDPVYRTGNVAIGATSAISKLHVYEGNTLGINAGNSQILSTIAGSSSNLFMNNQWLVRENNSGAQNWWNAKFHDGISIDMSFLTPGVNTRTWWERHPYKNIQSWGNGSDSYMTLKEGRLWLGPATNQNLINANTALLAIGHPNSVSNRAIAVIDPVSGYNDEHFTVYGTGKTEIAIGSQLPPGETDAFIIYNGVTLPAGKKAQFKVTANGYVYAREINVLPANMAFPDYVFQQGYKLMTLPEVEKYIQKNQHLPNLPSAREVETNGMNLSEMQVKQMEKIEELFLHVIELKKENEQLKAQVTELKNK